MVLMVVPVPLGDLPTRYTRRMWVIGIIAIIAALIGLFVFRTAVPLLLLLVVPWEIGIYLWWRHRARP